MPGVRTGVSAGDKTAIPVANGATNSQLALLAVLSDGCANHNTLSSSLQVNINEITGVAGECTPFGYLSAPNALLDPGTSAVQLLWA